MSADLHIAEFAAVWGLPLFTVKTQMKRGYCKWPRVTFTGQSKHPLFQKWRDMLCRCTSSSHRRYQDWGGRGIKVCNEWFLSFDRYVKDIESLGPKPGPGYSIDRIDNDGNYELSNVRWASKKEQALNRRPRG
jgi:hypothetical protein